MTIPISLAECPGLIDLMLTGDELGPDFTLNGVRCSIERIDGGACFEARTADFDLMAIFPGWYTGDHGRPAYIVIIGEVHECLRWLPMDREDKRTLIARLPLSAADQALCELMI